MKQSYLRITSKGHKSDPLMLTKSVVMNTKDTQSYLYYLVQEPFLFSLPSSNDCIRQLWVASFAIATKILKSIVSMDTSYLRFAASIWDGLVAYSGQLHFNKAQCYKQIEIVAVDSPAPLQRYLIIYVIGYICSYTVIAGYWGMQLFP